MVQYTARRSLVGEGNPENGNSMVGVKTGNWIIMLLIPREDVIMATMCGERRESVSGLLFFLLVCSGTKPAVDIQSS